MKKFLSKVSIHPIYYILAIIAIVTGNFKGYVTISFVLIIHELGHILGSILFKWHIDKVIILPFGCLTKFNEKLNRPIYQELIILVMGPIFQCLLYLVWQNDYHYPLLLFNLLPIYPLDGSKILFLCCNKIMSYYHSYLTIFLISILTIGCFFRTDFIYLIIIFYLIYHLIIEYKKRHYIMNRFLFERYLYHFKFRKKIKINKINLYKMKRGCYHFFCDNKKIYSEDEILQRMFDK